jgi:hypothetical protein
VVGIRQNLGDAYPDPDDGTARRVVVDIGPVKKLTASRDPGQADRKADPVLQGLSICKSGSRGCR